MLPRIHVEGPLTSGAAFALPAAQARHVQVLRLQPGAALVLFDGRGGEWQARITAMTRAGVDVRVDAHVAVERELGRAVTLAIGMPANERMDALVEKATELGVAAIQPLVCERSVLRLAGDRAAKRLAHWRGVATAAAEQSGRTRLPQVHAVQTLRDWLDAVDELDARGAATATASARGARFMLSPDAPVRWGRGHAALPGTSLLFLSGPEGGFSEAEEENARRSGFVAVSLGERVLRADTAPLAVLAWCGFVSCGFDWQPGSSE